VSSFFSAIEITFFVGHVKAMVTTLGAIHLLIQTEAERARALEPHDLNLVFVPSNPLRILRAIS